jgi:hypothetical protein
MTAVNHGYNMYARLYLCDEQMIEFIVENWAIVSVVSRNQNFIESICLVPVFVYHLGAMAFKNIGLVSCGFY